MDEREKNDATDIVCVYTGKQRALLVKTKEVLADENKDGFSIQQ